MLKVQLMEDMKVAMREKDVIKKGVLMLLRSGIANMEKEKGTALASEEEITILSRELKQTKESLAIFENAGREDLVGIERTKIAIIESYLPKQMTEAEILELLGALNIDKTQNAGRIIGQVMPLVKGKADGKEVKRIVEAYVKG